MKLILLGAPGAGKGTQAEIVCEKLSIPSISTGNILREAVKNGTQAGLEAKSFMDAGALVPDAVVMEIDRVIEIDVPDEVIESRLGGRRVCESCGASYHVVNKAPAVDGICDKCGGKLIIRKDDKPETIKDRLAVYHEQTAPLADYYRKAGKLFTVDGTQEISAITAQLLSILEA